MTRDVCRLAHLALASLLSGSGISMTARDAVAQDPTQLVDRIVAVVGDTAVLQSELQEFIIRLRAQGLQLPDDPEQLDAFYRRALEQKVNEVLLVLSAGREGITLSEAEINELVEDRIAQVKRQFPSQLDYEEALSRMGVSAAEYRIQIADQVRSEAIAQRYLQQKLSEVQPVPVSEEEIRERFEAQRPALGPKPATIGVKQVVITPKPVEEERLRVQEIGEAALSRARSGEDFAKLAREYSDDLATRAKGGQLGWVRKGQLLPEFEEALFKMRAGQVSDLVETAVGLHIIKLERIRGAERSARHILIQPELTAADFARAGRLAEDVAAALRAGADADSLIGLHGDPQERASLTNFPEDRLPPDYRSQIGNAEPGDVIAPFQLTAQGAVGGKWFVVKLLERSPSGEWTLDDVRETLRLQIQQDRMLQRVVEQLREATFIETRLEDYPVTR